MVTEGKQGNLFSAVFEGHVEAVGAGSPTEPWILVTTSAIALLRNITRMGGRCVGRAGRDTRAVAGRLNRARSFVEEFCRAAGRGRDIRSSPHDTDHRADEQCATPGVVPSAFTKP